MSAVPAADAASKSASKKKRKNKKKGSEKNKPSNDTADANGARDEEDEGDDGEGDNDDTPLDAASRKHSVAEDPTQHQDKPTEGDSTALPIRNGTQQPDSDAPLPLTEKSDDITESSTTRSDTSARLDAMAKERDTLQAQVAELRKYLESMRGDHIEEVQELKTKAQDAQTEKEGSEISKLRKEIEAIQQTHQNELDSLKAKTTKEQTEKESAQVADLRKEIETIQQTHQQKLEDLKANAAKDETDRENAQVAELREEIETIQKTHRKEVENLKSQAKEPQSDNDNAELSQLRESLEKQQQEVENLKGQVQEAESGRDNAESQYRSLLGKVNTIRSQLGERLKADAEELARARTEIEELQQQSQLSRESQEQLESTIAKLQDERKSHVDEIDSLRSRTNVSQSNWVKERDELVSREAFAREEFESARQAMQDWEVLAMEERSLRENLNDRVVELEEQLNGQREAYERAANDRDTQNSTVDALQRALQDIQDARKKELREMVENSQAQLDALRAQAEEAKSASASSEAELEKLRKDLERALPFEKEVKEKNLLIGKLRHEAVILNDHLTKALRFLKRGKPEDNVDRHIVTNHFLHFLMLDRSDPKKFQILQLIAALLGWTEEQREQAGLARPGASNSSLRIPLSPFRRTPSAPSLNNDLDSPTQGGSKESLAELWSEFLEREAHEGGAQSSASRSGSFAAIRSPSVSERPGSAGLGIKSPKPSGT